MKTMIITIALIGFTAVGSYAQNKVCNSKQVSNKKVATERPIIRPRIAPKDVDPTCFMGRKNNAGITQCTYKTYDQADVAMEYGAASTYTANYPKMAKTKIKKLPVEARTENVMMAVNTNDYGRPAIPCSVRRRHNIVVTECPDAFYDNTGVPVNADAMDVRSEDSYTGNYPKKEKKAAAPQVENIETGNTLPGQNLCFYNCK
jgi:hypothetical protein